MADFQKKKVIGPPLLGAEGVDTICTTVCQTAVTVPPRIGCVVWSRRRPFSSGFAITERRDMGLYEVPLSMSLLGFGVETILANFHMCGIMLWC